MAFFVLVGGALPPDKKVWLKMERNCS